MNKIHAFCLISLTLFSLSLLQAAECDKLKVMSYNICTLFKTYDTNLDIKHRIPRILDQINKESPDVIVLQEARKVEADVLKEHLSQTGYCPILSSVNETPLAATLITAFKHEQFVCKETICWWYNNENPNIFGGNDWYKWGRILTATMICRANDPQQKPIVICNTHLGLHRDEKTFSIQLGLQLLENKFKDNPLLWCGDFNFFEDDGGSAHRALITDAGYQDTLEKLTDTKGNDLNGTFVGYSVDGPLTPKTKATLSRLDGIFTRNINHSAKAQCIVAIDLADDLSNRDELPSDHLPILLSIPY